jgi:hypothetical protein
MTSEIEELRNRESWVLLVARYIGEEDEEEIKLLPPLDLGDGTAGILLFRTTEDARAFADAHWEVVGSGWEALTLSREGMVYCLTEIDSAATAEYVLINPPSHTRAVRTIGVRDLLELWGESDS